MKDKIIVALFVIFLTFLVLRVDVQAETVGAPYDGDVGDLTEYECLRWIYSFPSQYRNQNMYGYCEDGSNFLIIKSKAYNGNDEFYAVAKKSAIFHVLSKDINKQDKSDVWTSDYKREDIGDLEKISIFSVGAPVSDDMSYQYDYEFNSYDEIVAFLNENADSLLDDEGNIVLPDDGSNDTPPTFYLKSYAKWGMLKYVEYTLTWDIDESFVAENPSGYSFRLYATVKNDATVGALISQPMKEMSVTSTILPSFYSNGLTFNMNDVKDCINFFQRDSVENHFWLWVQLTDKEGIPLNNNYIRVGVTKGIEITQFDIVDDKGNVQYSYGHWNKNTGQYEYDDGRESNSNGSSQSEYSKSDKDYDGNSKKPMTGLDDYTDETNDFTSSASNVTNVLNNTVNSITSVISVFSAVWACFPTWLTDLISVSIGIIVIVGLFMLLKP